MSSELQAVIVDILDSQQCNSLLRLFCSRHWCGVQDYQICADKVAGGVDACQIKIPLSETKEGSMHFLIRVTSFGISCARPNLLGATRDTRVSSFVDWIESIVWPDN